jgi:hypothetical protein
MREGAEDVFTQVVRTIFLSKIKLKSSEVERNRKVLKNDKKLEIKVQDKKCNKQKE